MTASGYERVMLNKLKTDWLRDPCWGIKAAQLGCPGNLELAACIIQLEDRIKRLESALADSE